MEHQAIVEHYDQFVDIIYRITDAYLYDGRINDAVQVAENGLQIVDDNSDVDPNDLVRLLLQLGELLNRRSFYDDPAFEKVIRILTRAQQMAEDLGNQELLATALLRLGQAHDYQTMNTGEGDYQDALDYFEQALALSQEANLFEGEGKAIFNIGLIYQRQRDLEKARQHFSRAYEIAVQGGYRLDQSLAIRHLGFVHFVAGDYELAEECAQESLSLREELGYRLYLPPAHHVLGSLYIAQEKWESAFAHLEQANALAEEMKLNAYLIQIQLSLGEWYKRQGIKDDAQRCFQKAYDLAVVFKHRRWQKAAEADLKALQTE